MSKNLDCTNYCLQCEEAAKKVAELQAKLAEQQVAFLQHGKVNDTEELNNLLAKAKEEGRKEIEELQRQNAMLIDAIACPCGDVGYFVDYSGEPQQCEFCYTDPKSRFNALSATSAQSAVWLEAYCVEWMKGLPIARYLYRYQTQDRSVVDIALRGSEEPTESIALYAIPTKKD